MFKKEYIINNPKTVFFLLACLINIEFLLGPYAPVRIDDIFDIGLVAMKSVGQNLLKYGIHFWDSSAISGVVTAASAGFSIFHPAVILAGFLPLWSVYFLWNIFAAFGAGYGMYLYLTRVLKLSLLASFFGGLIMLGIPRQTSGFVDIMLYLFPLYLYCFERCVNELTFHNRWKYILILVVIFISTLPHTTIPFYPVMHLAIILFLIRPINVLRKHFIWFILIWLIYIIVQAPTLYLLITESPYSQRIEFQRYWLATYYIGQWVVDNILKPALNPNLFTLLPTALLIISVFFIRNRIVLFWWGLCLIIMMLVSITESSFGLNLYRNFKILVTTVKVPRFTVIIPFAFCLLSSYGISFLEKIYKNELKTKFVLEKIFPIILLFLICLSTYLFFRHPSTISGIIIICFLYLPIFLILIYYFISYRFKKSKHSLRGIWLFLILLFILAGFRAEFTLKYTLIPYNFYFHNPIAKRIRLESDISNKSPFRVVDFGCIPFSLQYHGLQSLDGNIGMYPVKYKHYWEKVIEPWLSKTNKIDTYYFLYYGPKVYLNATEEAYIKKDDVIYYKPQANLNLLALGNVKYIFSTKPIDSPEVYNLRPYLPQGENEKEYIKFFDLKKKMFALKSDFSYYHLKDLLSYVLRERFDFHLPQVVYILNNTLPRAFIVPNWNVYRTGRDAMDALSHMSVDEISKKVILVKNEISKENLPKPQEYINWSSRIITYEPDYVKINASSDKNAILILTDNFHRNWKAFIDGKPVIIFPAYGTFRGVVVPRGKFTVEFRYQDRVLIWLYLISLTGLLSIMLLAVVLILNRSKEKK